MVERCLCGGRVPERSSFQAKKVKALLFKTCSGVRHASFSRYHHLLHPHFSHLATWSPKPWIYGMAFGPVPEASHAGLANYASIWSACIQSKLACLTVENSRLISKNALPSI